MKKVIVISTSLRKGSNSDMLADKFIEGATAAGHNVEKVSLVGKEMKFCIGSGHFACHLTPQESYSLPFNIKRMSNETGFSLYPFKLIGCVFILGCA